MQNYLYLSYLFCIFAGKFTNKMSSMQINSDKSTNLGLSSYYEELGQKEKVKLKKYISQLFELSYYTVDAKFGGRAKFSAAELLALQPVIEREVWRQ